MKISKDFLLRKVDDMYVVITMGEAINKFNGMIKLNNTGAYIWNKLKDSIEMSDLINQYTKEFGISKEDAEKDINAFLETVKPTGCIEN